MFQLSAERVAALLKTDLKCMIARTKKEGRVSKSRLEEASKVKENYCRVFSYFYSITLDSKVKLYQAFWVILRGKYRKS